MANPPQVIVQQSQMHELSFADSDGTIHLRELDLRPSELCSREYRDWYAARLCDKREFPGLPARNAPKSEWDRFDAQLEDDIETRYLGAAVERYPVKIVKTDIAGVRAAIVSPGNGTAPKNQHRVLINLHGGGFVCYRGLSMGTLESIPVASLGQMTVITLDYRQAPFHQYPAASEDVEAVYRELLKQYAPAAIGIFGCSAGGALVAQAITWFRSKGLPRPGAVGIFSSAPSPIRANTQEDKGDSGIWWGGSRLPKSQLSGSEKDAAMPALWYMDNADRNDPVAYPMSADTAMEKFPPTLLLSGTRASDMSAVVTAHARLLRLGVKASLYIMEGGIHGAHVVAVDTPEAYDANAHVAQWFDEHLAK